MKWICVGSIILVLLLIFTPSISLPINESIYLRNNKVDYIGDTVLSQEMSFDNLNNALDSITPPQVDPNLYRLYQEISKYAQDNISTLVGSKSRVVSVSAPNVGDAGVPCTLQYYGDSKSNVCAFVNPLPYSASVTTNKGDILATYADLGVTIRIKSNEVTDSGKPPKTLFSAFGKSVNAAQPMCTRRHKDITAPSSFEQLHSQGHRVIISVESGSFSNKSLTDSVAAESGVTSDSVSKNSLYTKGDLFEIINKNECTLKFPATNKSGLRLPCYSSKSTSGKYALAVGNDSAGYNLFYNLPAKPKNRAINGYSSQEVIYKRKDTAPMFVPYVHITSDGVSQLNAAPRRLIDKYFGSSFTTLNACILSHAKDPDYNNAVLEIANRSTALLDELG